jgi:hypothetical protein
MDSNANPTGPLDALAAAVARMDAAGDTAGADQAIVLAMKGVLARIALAIGAERVAWIVHRAAWPDGGGGPDAPAIAPTALVAGKPETDGPAARRLLRLALDVAEPVLSEDVADWLAGATVRIDQDAKARTVLTAGAAIHAHGTPGVRREAVLMVQVLARRIQAEAANGGAADWTERLKLSAEQMRTAEAVELALLGAAGRNVAAKAWDQRKRRQPAVFKTVVAVLAAKAQGKPVALEHEAAVADVYAQKTIKRIDSWTNTGQPVPTTLKYLSELWGRADHK